MQIIYVKYMGVPALLTRVEMLEQMWMISGKFWVTVHPFQRIINRPYTPANDSNHNTGSAKNA